MPNSLDPRLLAYYEAIERASDDMLAAAQAGHWDDVVRLEGVCMLLISQLKEDAQRPLASLDAGAQDILQQDAARKKSRIMQRILVNDAEIRQLAEPWLQDLDSMLAGRRHSVH